MLKRKFEELESVLVLVGEKNWISGIQLILEILSKNEDNTNYDKAIRIYKSMNMGANSFVDFYIEDSSTELRIKKNIILHNLRDDIWKIIENYD